MTTSKVDLLRKEHRELLERFQRGDVPKRNFQRQETELSLKLYRAIIEERLAADEQILEEHHAVRAHMKLHQSVLKEPEEEAISLFLTDRRLLRLREVVIPGQRSAGDGGESATIDEVEISSVAGIRVRKEIRASEAFAGAAICVFALVFRSWLMVTGTLMFALGALGIIHGLLIPTRWIEVEVRGPQPVGGIMRVYGPRRKKARALVQGLRDRMVASG
jgi:hypothetical protein